MPIPSSDSGPAPDSLKTKEAFRRARTAVERALELDEGLAEAHSMLAFLSFVSDFDWTGAEREFKRRVGAQPQQRSDLRCLRSDVVGARAVRRGRRDAATRPRAGAAGLPTGHRDHASTVGPERGGAAYSELRDRARPALRKGASHAGMGIPAERDAGEGTRRARKGRLALAREHLVSRLNTGKHSLRQGRHSKLGRCSSNWRSYRGTDTYLPIISRMSTLVSANTDPRWIGSSERTRSERAGCTVSKAPFYSPPFAPTPGSRRCSRG